MSRKAAEEALGTDPRDLDLRMDLRKLLQTSQPEPIQDRATLEQVMASPATAQENVALPQFTDKAKTTG